MYSTHYNLPMNKPLNTQADVMRDAIRGTCSVMSGQGAS